MSAFTVSLPGNWNYFTRHFMRIYIFLILFGAVLAGGCHPKIYSFTAFPEVIFAKDSVRMNWKTRGRPELRFSQVDQPNPPGDTIHLLTFELWAFKGQNDSVPKTRQV